MKRLILGFLAVGMFLCLVGNSFAVPEDKDTYTNIYTVGNSNSEVQKTTFEWDEKPWLFLELPVIAYDWATTVSTWSWAGGRAYTTTPKNDLIINSGNKLWLAFSDARWEAFKREGDWIVSPASILVGGYTLAGIISGQTGFTVNPVPVPPVTPEPVSSALFLLGGGALFAAKRKKKN